MNESRQEELLSGTLEQVITSSEVRDELPLEQEGDEFSTALDRAALAEQLKSYAQGTGSILAKSRALLVAGRLHARENNQMAAEESARNAWTVSPKSSLAALFHRWSLRQASEIHSTDALVENLNSISATAQSSAAKIHASLQLSHLLTEQGEAEKAAALLDSLARGGVQDLRVEVQRVIARLSSNATVAGLTGDEALKKSAALAYELLSNQVSSFVTPLFSWLRCSRALAQGRVFEAGGYLVELAPDEVGLTQTQGMVELAAQLLATRPQGRPHALALLKKYQKQSSLKSLKLSRALLRLLARLALEQNDISALTSALGAADPASGTFEEAERILILQSAKMLPTLGAQEQEQLDQRQPILAWLLPLFNIISLEEPRLDSSLTERQLAHLAVQTTRDPAQVIRVIRSEADDDDIFDWRVAEPAHGETQKSLLLTALLSSREQTLQALKELKGQEAPDSESLEIQNNAPSPLRVYAHTIEIIARIIKSSELSLLANFSLLSLGSPAEGEQAKLSLEEILQAEGTSLRLGAYRALYTAQEPPLETLQLIATDLPETYLRRALFIEVASKLEAEAKLELLKQAELSACCASIAASIGHTGEKFFEDLLHNSSSELTSTTGLRLRQLLQIRVHQRHESLPRLLQQIAEHHLNDPDTLWLASIWASIDQDDQALLQLAESTPDDAGLRKFIAAQLLVQGHLPEATRLLALSAGEQSLSLLDELSQSFADYDRVFQVWSARAEAAKVSGDNELRLYCFERLAEIDRDREEFASAHLWRRTIGEVYPKHLPSLFEWEEQLFDEKSIEKWPPLGERLAQASLREEAEGYEGLSLLLLLGSGEQRRALKRLTSRGLSVKDFSTLELQLLYQYGRKQRDETSIIQVLEELFSRDTRAAARHYYAMKAGEAASRMRDVPAAISWFQKALSVTAGSVVAQLALSKQILKQQPSAPEVASAHLDLAQLLTEPTLKLQLHLKGAEIHEANDAPEKAIIQYREVLELEPAHEAAFHALENLLPQTNTLERIALRQARLDWAKTDDERFRLLLLLSQDLWELRRTAEAKESIEQALLLQPNTREALELHSELALIEEDYPAVLSSLESLSARCTETELVLSYQRKIAEVYLKHLKNLEKAMDAYEQVLKLKDNDVQAMTALISIFSTLGLGERATRLQTQLLQTLELESDKITAVIGLARLYEDLTNEKEKAAATLEKARQAWPRSPEILEALSEFMVRHGDEHAQRMLVDRSFKDAVRRLENNKLDPDNLTLVSKLSALKGHGDMARCAAHAHASLAGTAEDFKGIGLKALAPQLEAQLSNALFSPALLQLIAKVGPALDSAFPLDTSHLAPKKLSDGPVYERIQKIGEAVMGPQFEVYGSEELASQILPWTTSPPRLIVGMELEQLSSRAFDYAFVRSLKVLQMGTATLARTEHKDAWSIIAATLVLFSPNYEPKVEERTLSGLKTLIEQGLALTGYDADVPVIALEALGSLPPQPELTLGKAAGQVANRCALLAVGRLAAAFDVLAFQADKPLPQGGPGRLRWLEQRPIAKDLIQFSCSRGYSDLRSKHLSEKEDEPKKNIARVSTLPKPAISSQASKRRAPPGRLPQRSKIPNKPPGNES